MTLFTDEQMKGTGQFSMTALIQDNLNRIAELKKAPHIFWNDPGHGWLEARFQDLIVLDIYGSISGYSYRDGEKVYLEEDCDAGRYIDALFGPYGDRTPEQKAEFEYWRSLLKDEYRENIFIRNLRHIK